MTLDVARALEANKQSSIWRQVYIVVVSWLVELYLLTTAEVISGRVLTCGIVQSRRLYSAAPLGNQIASTMT